MSFKSVESRYALRAALAGILAAAGALQAYLPDVSGGEIVQTVIAGILGAGVYAGIGAAAPQVEPSIGNKSESG